MLILNISRLRYLRKSGFLLQIKQSLLNIKFYVFFQPIFMTFLFSSEWYPEEPCPELEVNSIIISAVAVKSSRNRTGVDELNTTALAEPIVITLQHKDATHVGPTCAFLNEQEVQMGNGRWLTEGCRVNENRSDSDTTVCECSHLTSFAILTSPAGPPVSQSKTQMFAATA